MATTTYSNGTISIGANSTSVAGSGTAWLTSGLREGDLFVAAGLAVPIQSVNSNTNITLARSWPGAGLSAANYDVLMLDDAVRSLVAANELLQRLTNGTLTSLAGLNSAANKLPYFSGANAMALTDLTSAGRAMLGLAGGSGAKVPVITGPGTAAMRDIVGNVWQSGGNPTGAIIERGSNANGEYTKYADGTIECWGRFPGETFACTTARGALFTSAFTAKPFPVSMGNISLLSCQASLIDPSGAAANLIGIKSAAGSSAEYSLSGIAVAAGTYTAVYAFHAIGRWF